MASLSLILVIILVFFHSSLAEQVAGRCYLGCSLVLDSIHCFGGNTDISDDNTHRFHGMIDEHLTMDLSGFDFTDTSNASMNWTRLTPSIVSSSLLEPIAFLTATSIANGTKFLIYGGAGTSLLPLRYPLKVFDPANSEWSTLPSYGNYSRFAPVVDLEATHQLWLWGGLLNSSNTITNPYGRALDYTTNQWSTIPLNPSTACGRYHHTATLAPSMNTIYIIGGKCRRASGDPFGANMLEIHSYDTIQSSWFFRQATTNNAQAIAPRMKHTTTLISGTNSFLIYGGDGADNPNVTIVNDYAYLYDFDKSVFTLLNLDSKVGAGPRTAHNAIAYKSYVMIMFGFNSQFEMLNDLHVLNTTDLFALHWLGDSPPTNGSSVSPPGSNNGLSTGATAGIAVAAAAVGVKPPSQKKKRPV
ncbi:unnamed protein product [Absidia cylindrospora]